MQSKISAFFKPNPSPVHKSPPKPSSCYPDLFAPDSGYLTEEPEITVTYKRKVVNPVDTERNSKESKKDEENVRKFELVRCGSALNNTKKRNYAQLFLDVGQSDFLMHTCSTCGFTYATGEEVDEKDHKTFHKNYTHGIPFKGWREERIVDEVDSGRIILVQDGDPLVHQNKVQDAVRRMEIELGEGWILTSLFKVYLFVSSQRITGCLVVEPIKTAYRLLPSSKDEKSSIDSAKEKTRDSTALHFGGVSLQREIIRKESSKTAKEESIGAIMCEVEAQPAVCGIRAIWVAPFYRKKHIASYLLDAARKSFDEELVIDHTQLAFSPPTAQGKALISSYTRTTAFLVYITASSE